MEAIVQSDSSTPRTSKTSWAISSRLASDRFGEYGAVRSRDVHVVFSWICASGLASDLQETDRIAQQAIETLMSNTTSRRDAVNFIAICFFDLSHQFRRTFANSTIAISSGSEKQSRRIWSLDHRHGFSTPIKSVESISALPLTKPCERTDWQDR